MTNSLSYEFVLWDFGDTLADERWMLVAPEGVSEWSETFVEKIWRGEWGESWNRGEIFVDEVARRFGNLLGRRPTELLDHMERCCRKVSLFANSMSAARRLECPQAIVTINPDIFTRWIVPNYRLADLFDVIVTSWEMGTLEKSDLCEEAIQRLGGIEDKTKALLIDNREDNVLSWKKRGGSSYHFRSDDVLGRDMSELFDFGADAT